MFVEKNTFKMCFIVVLCGALSFGCSQISTVILTIAESFDSDGYEEATPVYGPDKWKKNEAAYLKKEPKWVLRAEFLGVAERYENIYVHDNTRDILYEEKAFELVDVRLREHFSNADTPLKKHRYSQHVNYVGDFFYGEDPKDYLAVLDQWVKAMPDSYVPYMIRGSYFIDYAWYFRGGGWSSEVTNKGRRKYSTYMDRAEEDLLKAHELEPANPEPLASLVSVAGANGLGDSAMRRYYEQTLEINPHHYNVRHTMLNYMQPKWGGSWSDVDKIVEDSTGASEEFPLLVMIDYDAQGMMYDRGSKYEGVREKAKMKRRWKEAFLRQSKQSPEDLFILADLSYHAVMDLDYKTATEAFQTIGERYPKYFKWKEVDRYNLWRAVSYASYSQYPDVLGTPQELELLSKALELDHIANEVIYFYIESVVRRQDTEMLKVFLENEYPRLPPQYLKGDKTDLTELRAIGFALHSESWGVLGTDEELEFLDKALELDPDNAFVLLYYAEYYDREKDYVNERKYLTKSREAAPDWVTLTHIFAWLTYHEKNYDKSIEYAQEFLAGPPSQYQYESKKDVQEILDLCAEKKAKLAKAAQ